MGLPRSRATITETWCCYIGEASRNDISGSYYQSELSLPIPWNQTLDVHRGSTLIT